MVMVGFPALRKEYLYLQYGCNMSAPTHICAHCEQINTCNCNNQTCDTGTFWSDQCGGPPVGQASGKILCGHFFWCGNVGVATTPAHHKPQPEGGVKPALQLEPQCVKPHLQWDESQCLRSCSWGMTEEKRTEAVGVQSFVVSGTTVGGGIRGASKGGGSLSRLSCRLQRQ